MIRAVIGNRFFEDGFRFIELIRKIIIQSVQCLFQSLHRILYRANKPDSLPECSSISLPLNIRDDNWYRIANDSIKPPTSYKTQVDSNAYLSRWNTWRGLQADNWPISLISRATKGNWGLEEDLTDNLYRGYPNRFDRDFVAPFFSFDGFERPLFVISSDICWYYSTEVRYFHCIFSVFSYEKTRLDFHWFKERFVCLRKSSPPGRHCR